MDNLLEELKKGCPQAVYLLTTPPGAYVRNGRRGARVINPRTKLVVKTELDYAASRKLAIWDMYHVVGGERYACLNWSNGNYFQRDKIHFTQEGYICRDYYYTKRLSNHTTIMWKLNWTELGIDLDRLKEVLTYDAAQPMIFSSGFFLLLFSDSAWCICFCRNGLRHACCLSPCFLIISIIKAAEPISSCWALSRCPTSCWRAGWR